MMLISIKKIMCGKQRKINKKEKRDNDHMSSISFFLERTKYIYEPSYPSINSPN